MIARTLTLITLLCLAACAPTIAGSNSRGGTITHVIGLTKSAAFAKAEAACHQYGRVARISGSDALDSSLTYDCVDP